MLRSLNPPADGWPEYLKEKKEQLDAGVRKGSSSDVLNLRNVTRELEVVS